MKEKRIVKRISVSDVIPESLAALAALGMDELGAIDGVPHVGTVVLVVEGELFNLVGERDNQEQLLRLSRALRRLKHWAEDRGSHRMPIITLCFADELEG